MSRKKNNFVFTEPSDIALKDVPMFTFDEVEVRLNSILYRVSWSSGYGWEKKGKAEIEALRVFYVNNSTRVYRAKCIAGCESIFKVADGCTSGKLYGEFKNAVAALREMIDEDVRKSISKTKAVEATLVAVYNEDKRVSRLKPDDIKLPKEIRI